MKSRVLLAGVAVFSLSMSAAKAQLSEVLLSPTDKFDNPYFLQVPRSFGIIGVNRTGGFAFSVRSVSSAGALYHVWGRSGPCSEVNLLVTIGTRIMPGNMGLSDDGAVLYHTTQDSGAIHRLFDDGVQVLATNGPVGSIGGKFWDRVVPNSATYVSGEVVFGARYRDAVDGPTSGIGLFTAGGGSVLLKSGDVVGGLGSPVAGAPSEFLHFGISEEGAHYLARVMLASGDHAMVLDGSVLMIGGMGVVDGNAIPVSAGGLMGEMWFLGYTGANGRNVERVTESGETMFLVGGVSNAEQLADRIMVNGQVAWRSGGSVGSFSLASGAVLLDADMNERGDVAHAWVNAPGDYVVFVNEQLVLRTGDPIDYSGNGVADTGITVREVTTLRLSEDGNLYLRMDLDAGVVNPRVVIAWIPADQLPATALGQEYCTSSANSTGSRATVEALGTSSVSTNLLTIQTAGLPSNQFNLLIYSDTPQSMPFGNGTLCLGQSGSGIARLELNPGNNGGTACDLIDLTDPPAPPQQIMANTTWYFQSWYRDPAAGGSFFNLSNAISILFAP